MFLLKCGYDFQDDLNNINTSQIPYPFTENKKQLTLAYDIKDAIERIVKHFYKTQLQEFKRKGKANYNFIESIDESFESFIEKIISSELFDVSNVTDTVTNTPTTFLKDHYNIGYEYISPNIEYMLWYSITPISHSKVVQKELDDLKMLREERQTLLTENDRLRKTNAILECEPYRGSDFFQMLQEEKTSGSFQNYL